VKLTLKSGMIRNKVGWELEITDSEISDMEKVIKVVVAAELIRKKALENQKQKE